MKIGVYAGSFDPITKGHFDVIKKSLKITDKLIVVVMNNVKKKCWFTLQEREEMVKLVTEKFGDRVEVTTYNGLLVDFVKKNGATVIIRGLRAVSDYEYELGYSFMNNELSNGEVDTIFIPANREWLYLSSSSVKEAATFGVKLNNYLDEKIIKMVEDRADKVKKM